MKAGQAIPYNPKCEFCQQHITLIQKETVMAQDQLGALKTEKPIPRTQVVINHLLALNDLKRRLYNLQIELGVRYPEPENPQGNETTSSTITLVSTLNDLHMEGNEMLEEMNNMISDMETTLL